MQHNQPHAFQHARLRGKVTPAVVLRDLTRLAAEAREVHGERFRARFLAAWLRTAPRELRDRLPSGAALARKLEEDGRLAWRRAVHHRRLRWLRPSSSTEAFLHGEQLGVARRDLAARLGGTEDLVRRALQEHGAGHARFNLDGSAFVIVADRAVATWETFARLAEHHLPAVRPACLVRAPRELAVFECAPHAEPFAEMFGSIDGAVDEHLENELAVSLARVRLLGALHDRALTTTRPLDGSMLEVVESAGEARFALCLAPPLVLEDLTPARVRRDWTALRESSPLLSEAALRDAYVDGVRGGAPAREAARASLPAGG